MYNVFLFNKTISLFYYSLFVFRLCYKIIGLSSLNLAGRGLTHLWPAGMGRAGAKHSRSGSGLGLNSNLRAWAGPGLKNYCGPGL